MSFLAPLYLLGGLSVIAPILWHLIRRRPKTQLPFSSLMFLRPSPPRITRRSRLENLPLLLLRILALLLLAIAFARPLFRGASETASVPEGRRVVVLVDTSASMQRQGIWEAAQTKVREIVDDLGPEDTVALLSFDDQPQVLWSFDESTRIAAANRAAQVDVLLKSLKPTWFASDLGVALSFAGDYARERNDLPTTEHPDANESIPTQIHVVSDMQSGSDISALQTYAWPDDSRLEVHAVHSPKRSNASLRVLAETTSSGSKSPEAPTPVANDGSVRVRVANAVGASNSTFSLMWNSPETGSAGAAVSTQIPPGESRVIRMPEPSPDAISLKLVGDDHEFDNEWFLIPATSRKSTVVYLGRAIEARRESLLYYVQRIPLGSRYHEITLERRDPDSLIEVLDPENVPLVIVGEPIPADRAPSLKEYLVRGGRVLWVLDDSKLDMDNAASLQKLTGLATLEISEASIADYAMFSKIDFSHELFRPLADSRFNDFSKIRTWSHRQVGGYPETWKRLIRFDSGDPALFEVPIGEGRLWLMTMGWQPQSSQLALSTKFIPLIIGMVRSRDARRDESPEYFAGDVVPQELLPEESKSASENEKLGIDWLTNDNRFAKPGVFRHGDFDIAVNVAPSESDTEPMPLESLERFGVTMGVMETQDESAARERQIQDTELERRQSLWQWAIACVLGLVGIETLLSGLKSRPQEGYQP